MDTPELITKLTEQSVVVSNALSLPDECNWDLAISGFSVGFLLQHYLDFFSFKFLYSMAAARAPHFHT